MLILPAFTATLVLLAYIARLTRAGVVAELRRTYVRTAVLKGLPRRTVIVRHVLRNALMPTITVVAISFGWLISGLIVIENVFNYPGLGRLLLFAIDRRDLPLLQAVTMVTVLGFALANLLADLLYAWLNPRIRLGVVATAQVSRPENSATYSGPPTCVALFTPGPFTVSEYGYNNPCVTEESRFFAARTVARPAARCAAGRRHAGWHCRFGGMGRRPRDPAPGSWHVP
jgi:hypothetical protein